MLKIHRDQFFDFLKAPYCLLSERNNFLSSGRNRWRILEKIDSGWVILPIPSLSLLPLTASTQPARTTRERTWQDITGTLYFSSSRFIPENEFKLRVESLIFLDAFQPPTTLGRTGIRLTECSISSTTVLPPLLDQLSTPFPLFLSPRSRFFKDLAIRSEVSTLCTDLEEL